MMHAIIIACSCAIAKNLTVCKKKKLKNKRGNSLLWSKYSLKASLTAKNSGVCPQHPEWLELYL